MISLHIGKLLEQAGFGTLDVSGSVKSNGIYTEYLDVSKTGLTIYTRGADMARGVRRAQVLGIESRGVNNVAGQTKLEDLLEYIKNSYVQCTLPTPIMLGTQTLSDKKYSQVTIEVISNVENKGADPVNRVIYGITIVVRYQPIN